MKIAVGLSGGVDSSVAAWLLKEQGHEVIALFMQNWHNTTGTLYGDCPWKDDKAIAQMVAKKLEIPFHFIDLSEEYSKRVVDYMFSEYKMGRTPNPDILCNREIKFEVFLKTALKLGVDYVATGHYCRKETIVNKSGQEIHRILAGTDLNKDQSYFLCQLSQKQLSKALFPIGHLLKSEVREIAAKAALPSANKKDSQGICFVGKVDLPVFLEQKLEAKDGNVVEIFKGFYEGNKIFEQCNKGFDRVDNLSLISKPYSYCEGSGTIIGTHTGAHFYTIGQRKGLNIGGHVNPLFIISTDVNSNTIYVGEGQDHPGLFRKALFIRDAEVHWIRPDLTMKVGETRDYQVRIRYRQPLKDAMLICKEEGIYVVFNEPQRGIAPGQFAAWYKDEEMIGSGVIS
ncbi:MAG: tRNA 2-thiouridine(34) synthase MnmA [Bacteroidales bacterium]